MRSLVVVSMVLFAACQVGCKNESDEEISSRTCKKPDAATAVTSAQLTPDWDMIDEEDGVQSIPVEIRASIPCLIGTVTATVMTSRGKLGDKGPGEAFEVLLTPTEVGNDEGHVEGEFVLELPAGRSARLDVRLGDWSAALLIEGPDAEPGDERDVGAVDTHDGGADQTGD